MSVARIAVFMGTRPEAIKMAPVVRALALAPGLEPIVISTGQHREMLDPVAELFGFQVQHELSVMQPNQQLAELTARLLLACDDLVRTIRPALALVQGDTTTVLAAALACFYRNVPVGHVEAGLRTGNVASPFPEEMNRTLVSRIATLHFAPTEAARRNLVAEGVPSERISVSGNTVIDALQAEIARQRSPSVLAQVQASLRRELGERALERPFVLVTGHRRENLGSGLDQICEALVVLAARFAGHDFIYPVHLNPNVQQPVRARLAGISNVRLIQPQPYSTFVTLLGACHLVLTDSGGVQEEAPSLGKPVLLMRDTTERPEGVEAGTVRLVGTSAECIVSEVSRLLTDPSAYAAMARATSPHGDGQAAPRIVERVREHLLTTG